MDKDGNESVVTISYKINFIDSARFMATSLSNLLDNLAEGIHKIKCKNCDCFLKCESVNDKLIKYKCLSCNKDYSNKLDEKRKIDLRTYPSFLIMLLIVILFLRKGVYTYEYMDDWEKFNEAFLPGKVESYSNLNTEDITDSDYIHAKRVCKDFEIIKFR